MTQTYSFADTDSESSLDSKRSSGKVMRGRKKQTPGHQKAKLKQNHIYNVNAETHGDEIKTKSKNHVRLFFQNVDGIFPASEMNCSKTTKTARLRKLCDDLEIDIVAMSEVGIQWDLMGGMHKLNGMISDQANIRSIVGWNTHEKADKLQQGGTGIIIGRMLLDNIEEMGVDNSGLGRWCWVKFKGEDNISSRIISAYQPCHSKNIAGVNCYAQQRRYLRKQGFNECPRWRFKEDLIKLLYSWISNGDRILLVGDFNEDCGNSEFSKVLKGRDLGMIDVIGEITNKPGPATWINGRLQIDGAFATKDFEISKGCFMPFFAGIGDHRAIILDIPYFTALGIKRSPICRPKARRLINIPKIRNKYLKELEKYCKTHKILKRCKLAKSKISYPISHMSATELNKIDRLRKEGMLHAERKCRKLHMGAVDFSEEVNKKGKEMYLWKLVIKLKNGKKISRSKIKRTAKSCGIKSPLSFSLREATIWYRAAKQEYYKRKPYSQELREIFLERKISNYSSEGKYKEMNIIKNILKGEQQRRAWRIVNKYTKAGRAEGVSKVEVNQNGVWVKKDSNNEVETAIMEELCKRFRLTEETPLMKEPLRNLIGLLANTEYSRKILEGTAEIPQEVDRFTKLFLSKLKRVNTGWLDPNISADDFIRYWRRPKEKKASSFSGLHFGHYKAATASRYLSTIHAILTTLASISGFAYDRWKCGLRVMLEKIAGVIKVDKLRAILLMEADFNHHNKEIFGRRMIDKAEKDGLLPCDQYGSRNNHRAIEVAFNRLMFFDVVRLKKVGAALVSVDAAQCYDRMTHAAISLCGQHVGVPVESITSMLLAIQAMQFFIRTAFGDSKTCFKGTDQKPFQGSIQGNGASPGNWLLISSIIIKCMYDKGILFRGTTAISLYTVSFAALAFVDDTDLIQMAESGNVPTSSIIDNLQESINLWNGCLTATGGALRPEKCNWYLMDFKWRSDGSWYYCNKNDIFHLKVKGDNNQVRNIKQLTPDKAKEAVGVLQRPDGRMDDEFTRCKKVCDEWAVLVKNGHLSRKLALLGLKNQLWPKLEYRLPVTTFTEQQGDEIVKQLYWQILPNLGASRNFPKVFRYASYDFYGLELPHPYIEQGIKAVEMVLTYGNSDCLSFKMFRMELEQFQLEVGSGKIFFDLDHTKWAQPITKCWLWYVWEFVSRFKIKVHSKIAVGVQRVNDKFIMDIMHTIYTNTEILRSINRCRQYLEVLTLADITTGDGSKVRENILQVQRLDNERSKYKWSIQKPSAKDKRTWTDAIRYITKNLQISPQLGVWLNDSHKHNSWWYSVQNKCIYKQVDSGYLVFSSTLSQYHRKGWTFYLSGWQEEVTGDLLRTTVRILNEKAVIYEGSCEKVERKKPPEDTIKEFLMKYDESNMFNNMDIPENNINLAKDLANGTLIGIADGSFFAKRNNKLAAAAWIIEGIQSSDQCKGACLAPKGKAGSYRAELTGLYCILCVTLATCKVHQISQGCIYIGCDNDTSIDNASKTTCKVMQKQKDVDLIRAIRHIKKLIPITIKFIKVKGHLDEIERYEDLDRPSQLNVICDRMAKDFLLEAIGNKETASGTIPHEFWGVSVNNMKMTSSIGKAVRYEISKERMSSHLIAKGKSSQDTFNLIDWLAIGNMMRESTGSFKIWISKHMSGFCATGRRMKIIGSWPNSLCPCCKTCEETTEHILKCPAKKMREIHAANLEEIKRWLLNNDTKAELYTAITNYIKGRGYESFIIVDNREPLRDKVIADVNRLGWTNFMEGKIPITLGDYQEIHLQDRDSRISRDKWMSNLIQVLTRGILRVWLERNDILHAREKNGLRLEEADKLWRDIQHQLTLGSGGLGEAEKREWTRANNRIKEWSASEQKTWLSTMEISRRYMLHNKKMKKDHTLETKRLCNVIHEERNKKQRTTGTM